MMKQWKSLMHFCILSLFAIMMSLSSCNSYLDVAPDDGIATEDMVFELRDQAIKSLYSCYSFLPSEITTTQAPTLFGGGEFYTSITTDMLAIFGDVCYFVNGQQNVTSPYFYDWANMYKGIRFCNSLIERIHEVLDMEEWEKKQWEAEAKVVKAYLLFHLVKKWGPVYIPKANMPVSASVSDVMFYRNNIDECFDYMFELIDEALPFLPDVPMYENEYGRFNKHVALAFKAKMAVFAASPLFNNNSEMSGLVDNLGNQLFPSKSEDKVKERWKYAVEVCKDAIDLCHEVGKTLYYYDGSLAKTLDSHLMQELHIREAICDSWNDEYLWSHMSEYGSYSTICKYCTIGHFTGVSSPRYTLLTVPLKIIDMFYTKHGIPTEYDLERMSIDLDADRIAANTEDEKWYMQSGYKTKERYFDREPRFYADIAFDGALSMYSATNLTPSNMRKVDRQCMFNAVVSCLGHTQKKLTKFDLRDNSSSQYTVSSYTLPSYRLADLYLLYAEAINEAEGPNGAHSEDLFYYLDAIRQRAGIPGVKEAWDTYSNAPGKYNTQIGMREIIHRERLIELVFENQRYWDLRRWKEVAADYAKGMVGWTTRLYNNYDTYYKQIEYYKQEFSTKDYFWPIATSTLEKNPNLVQNLGWK